MGVNRKNNREIMMNHFYFKRFYFYRANGQDVVC